MPNEDPIVMYLIVRESLNMTAGKVCAQIGHGVQNILIHYFRAQIIQAKLHEVIPAEADHIKLTTKWLSEHSRKVVLKADEGEFQRVKDEHSDCVVIRDLGLTQLEPNTETVICLWPQIKSSVSRTVKRLQVY